MKNIPEEYLIQISQMFMKYGIKSITMNDVASNLGISKKTLYQFVSNKDALVNEVINWYLEKEQRLVDDIIRSNNHAIEEFVALFKQSCVQLREMNTATIYDLQKYHPQAWAKFQDYLNGCVRQHIISNLQKGIKQACYRNDLSVEIVADIYILSIQRVQTIAIDKKADYSFINIYKEYVNYHIHGILSPSGFESYLQLNIFE